MSARSTRTRRCSTPARRTIERLATDRHYFARPGRTLFNDIRIYFPMRAQHRVWRVVACYVGSPTSTSSSQPMRGFDLDGNAARVPRHHAQGHAVPAHAAAAQRLLPVAPAPRRDRDGGHRRLGRPQGLERLREALLHPQAARCVRRARWRRARSAFRRQGRRRAGSARAPPPRRHRPAPRAHPASAASRRTSASSSRTKRDERVAAAARAPASTLRDAVQSSSTSSANVGRGRRRGRAGSARRARGAAPRWRHPPSRRAVSRSLGPCSWASTSAAPSPTRRSPSTGGSSPRKAPTTPARPVRGRHAGGRAALRAGRAPSRRGRGVRARDDGRDQRAARGPRRAHRADRHRGLHRRHRARPPGARPPLPPVRGRTPRRSSPPELRFGAPERIGPGRAAARARRGRGPAARRARRRRPRPRPSPSSCCTPTAHPATSGCSAPLLRERAARRRTCRCPTRSSGRFREYERTVTTVVDAALSPLLGRLPAPARRPRAARRACPRPRSCSPAAGSPTPTGAAAHAALTVLSGPAGGAAAAALRAPHAAGEPDALCFDMGGTSCDVCVIEGGACAETAGREIAGRAVGAAQRRHPHRRAPAAARSPGATPAARCASARARRAPSPGPPATAAAATEPTVTDANLLLGYLDGRAPLAGGVRLDRDGRGARGGARWPRELGLEHARLRRGHRARRRRRDARARCGW